MAHLSSRSPQSVRSHSAAPRPARHACSASRACRGSRCRSTPEPRRSYRRRGRRRPPLCRSAPFVRGCGRAFLPEGTPFRIHEQMELIGTTGAAYVHGGDMNVVVQGSSGIDCPDTLYWPSMHGAPVGALRSEIEHFVDCVTRGEPSTVVTPEEART